MIVHHMRFSKEVEKVFSDANYFSILRNPVIMFESLFNYMKTVAPQFNKAHTLGEYITSFTGKMFYFRVHLVILIIFNYFYKTKYLKYKYSN